MQDISQPFTDLARTESKQAVMPLKDGKVTAILPKELQDLMDKYAGIDIMLIPNHYAFIFIDSTYHQIATQKNDFTVPFYILKTFLTYVPATQHILRICFNHQNPRESHGIPLVYFRFIRDFAIENINFNHVMYLFSSSPEARIYNSEINLLSVQRKARQRLSKTITELEGNTDLASYYVLLKSIDLMSFRDKSLIEDYYSDLEEIDITHRKFSDSPFASKRRIHFKEFVREFDYCLIGNSTEHCYFFKNEKLVFINPLSLPDKLREALSGCSLCEVLQIISRETAYKKILIWSSTRKLFTIPIFQDNSDFKKYLALIKEGINIIELQINELSEKKSKIDKEITVIKLSTNTHPISSRKIIGENSPQVTLEEQLKAKLAENTKLLYQRKVIEKDMEVKKTEYTINLLTARKIALELQIGDLSLEIDYQLPILESQIHDINLTKTELEIFISGFSTLQEKMIPKTLFKLLAIQETDVSSKIVNEITTDLHALFQNRLATKTKAIKPYVDKLAELREIKSVYEIQRAKLNKEIKTVAIRPSNISPVSETTALNTYSLNTPLSLSLDISELATDDLKSFTPREQDSHFTDLMDGPQIDLTMSLERQQVDKVIAESLKTLSLPLPVSIHNRTPAEKKSIILEKPILTSEEKQAKQDEVRENKLIELMTFQENKRNLPTLDAKLVSQRCQAIWLNIKNMLESLQVQLKQETNDQKKQELWFLWQSEMTDFSSLTYTMLRFTKIEKILDESKQLLSTQLKTMKKFVTSHLNTVPVSKKDNEHKPTFDRKMSFHNLSIMRALRHYIKLMSQYKNYRNDKAKSINSTMLTQHQTSLGGELNNIKILKDKVDARVAIVLETFEASLKKSLMEITTEITTLPTVSQSGLFQRRKTNAKRKNQTSLEPQGTKKGKDSLKSCTPDSKLTITGINLTGS